MKRKEMGYILSWREYEKSHWNMHLEGGFRSKQEIERPAEIGPEARTYRPSLSPSTPKVYLKHYYSKGEASRNMVSVPEGVLEANSGCGWETKRLLYTEKTFVKFGSPWCWLASLISKTNKPKLINLKTRTTNLNKPFFPLSNGRQKRDYQSYRKSTARERWKNQWKKSVKH